MRARKSHIAYRGQDRRDLRHNFIFGGGGLGVFAKEEKDTALYKRS